LNLKEIGMASSTGTPTYSFKLPLGLLRDGKVLKNVEIRPMTGNDRVLMASPQFRSNAGKLITALLKNCLVSVEGKSPSPTDALDMTVGDRDFLLLMLRSISMEDGDVIHASMKCSACGEQLNDVAFLVEDIPIIEIDTKKLKIEDDKYYVTIKDKKMGVDVDLQMVTGKEQEKISPLASKNPFSADYKMYELCLTRWNDETPPFSHNFVQSQPTRVLDWLAKEYKKTQAGPDWNQKVSCEICNGQTAISLADSDFLLPTQR